MKVTCVECDSENVDQGIDESLLCHDCGCIMGKYKKIDWQYPAEITNIER